MCGETRIKLNIDMKIHAQICNISTDMSAYITKWLALGPQGQ